MGDIINSFPGYEFVYDPKDKKYHNMYRGVDVGKGGYVFAQPNIYTDVALLDISSQHPHSMLALNYFGDYTPRFKELIDVRIAIKHRDFDTARKMFDGKLAKYLEDEDTADMLSKAMKLPINGSYGLTAATFSNPMRHPKNVNNIVALRGALFMKTLQDEVTARGYIVAHIKTDSIKVPNATPEIIDFIMEFGKKYGYSFEHECTYDRMCLVNDAVYIAKYATAEKCQDLYGYAPGDNKKHGGEWTATGTQFAIPYVFKTLFTGDRIEFSDLCQTFESRTGALYLDNNEALPDVSGYEKELEKLEDRYKKGNISDTTFEPEAARLVNLINEGHDYRFIGRVGSFTPVKCGGGVLYAKRGDKYAAAPGTTGYRWMEAELVQANEQMDNIDVSYFTNLVDKAVETISQYGDFEWFASDDPLPRDIELPWLLPCGDPTKKSCFDCSHFNNDPYHMDCAKGHDISGIILNKFNNFDPNVSDEVPFE